MNFTQEIFDRINDRVNKNNIILFLKGTSSNPVCGFSATAVKFLKKINTNFAEVNVLEEVEYRENMKHYSNFPTFPQLYINGKFIGGGDTIKLMYKSGELEKIIIKES